MKLPGFIDSHLHVLGIGYFSYNVDLSEVDSIEELKRKLEPHKNETIIIGRGWNQERFREKRMLTKQDLNDVSQTVPIVLSRVCGHVLTVNDCMLKLAGIDQYTPQVEGGSFSFHNGVFTENAIGLIHDNLPKPTIADIRRYLITADKILLSQGITSVASDDFCIFPIPYETIMSTINDLYREDLLHVKITEQVNLGYRDLQDFIAKGYVNKDFGKYRMGPLKILADGSLGGKTAYLSNPYENDSTNRGICTHTDEELFEKVHLADKNGMDVVIHAIGDAASEQAINALIHSLKITGRTNHHHALIHAQLTTKEQIKKMKQWNIGAIVQPIFLNSDIAIVKNRLGERAKETYLFKTMHTAGIPVGFSTDAPVEPVSPFLNIYSAITRKSLSRPDLGVFLEAEAFDFETALSCYTEVNKAYVYHDDSIANDYVIVDRSYTDTDSLLKMRILETVIDGKIVYQAENGQK